MFSRKQRVDHVVNRLQHELNRSSSAASVITKKSILITSAGRTGTAFFAKLFGNILTDCDSFHEPDVFKKISFSVIAQHLEALRNFGTYHYVFGKALSTTSIRALSEAYVGGRKDPESIGQQLLKLRKRFVDSLPGDVYVEANNQLYGLIEVIPRVFQQYRVVYLIRDGRDWVRSVMNHQTWFGVGDMAGLLRQRISPATFGDADLERKWSRWSRFERLCWTWSAINSAALAQIEQVEHARVFRFEDIFQCADREVHLSTIIRFATTFPAGPIPQGQANGALEERVNESAKDSFPPYQNWTTRQKAHFEATCGALMRHLGYSQFPQVARAAMSSFRRTEGAT